MSAKLTVVSSDALGPEGEPSSPTFKDGGGGGTSDGMEVRVAALEKLAEKIDGKLDKLISDVNELRIKVALIDGKLTHVPSIWQTITLVFGILGGAFVILKFGLVH